MKIFDVFWLLLHRYLQEFCVCKKKWCTWTTQNLRHHLMSYGVIFIDNISTVIPGVIPMMVRVCVWCVLVFLRYIFLRNIWIFCFFFWFVKMSFSLCFMHLCIFSNAYAVMYVIADKLKISWFIFYRFGIIRTRAMVLLFFCCCHQL